MKIQEASNDITKRGILFPCFKKAYNKEKTSTCKEYKKTGENELKRPTN